MVLRTAFALGLAALCAGCIHHVPQARLAQATPIAVVTYVDRAEQPAAMDMPPEVTAAIHESLAARNLVPRDVPGNPKLRNTNQRLAELGKQAGDASLVMLVETKVVYFDEMEGRYKWTVYAK